MCLIFTYSIISAVFHQFHEVVASDNSRRDNIHETHFGVVDLEIEKETGLSYDCDLLLLIQTSFSKIERKTGQKSQCDKPPKVEQIKKNRKKQTKQLIRMSHL